MLLCRIFVCPLLTYDCKQTDLPLTSQLIQQNRQNRIILYGFMISICTIRPVFKVTTMHTLRLVSITHPKSLLAARSLIYSTPKYASYAPDLPSRCDRGTSDSPRYRLLLRTCFYIKCLSVPCYCNDIVMTFMRFVGDS